ncbi:MAG: leucyl aminopeptidase [Brevinematia bacterium]
MRISFIQTKDFHKSDFDALVLFKFQNEEVKTPSRGLSNVINQFLKKEDFKGKFGEIFLIPKISLQRKFRFNKVIVLGCGEKKDLSIEKIRSLGSLISKNSSQYKYLSVYISSEFINTKLDKTLSLKALIEGLMLGEYRFDKFMSKKDEEYKQLESVEIERSRKFKSINIEDLVKKVKIIVESVFLARDLQNLPSNVATPTYIANIAKEECEKVGIRVKIIEKEEAEKLGMGCYLAVAKGSEESPKFVVMEYEGGGDGWYGIIGKGVTFDTGGISLKPSEKMEEMKFDMSGAASVIGTMVAIAKLKLKLNVVGITPLTENMPSGKATKPGDIVKSMGGIYVEIINTDAEGRLIMADALEYVKKYQPKFVIDIATLTGACMVALGHEAAGLMGNDKKLIETVKKSAERTQERVWELPLWEDYDEYIKSNFADVKNVGNRYGGAITAAAFLKKFTNYKWAHLDIAGTAYSEKEKYYIPKGGTGFGVRLLVDIFENLK